MKDEYSTMNSDGQLFVFPGEFTLESGAKLMSPQVCYRTFGQLNATRSNGFVVCHALTGNAALDSWWGEMLGPNKLFDTDKYFVICLNVLGSCYGTTGPTSINPLTNRVYGSTFPVVSIRDSVRLHLAAVQQGLNVSHLACVTGGSLGGMQSLEWACLAPRNYISCILAMCCGVKHTAWQIGISECQRQAVFADPDWKGGDYLPTAPPLRGLSVARQMAMVTYRTSQAYDEKFNRQTDKDQGIFQVEAYLRYQGVRFTQRFDALSYVRLTQLMDTHDLLRGRSRNEVQSLLALPVCVVSVNSDILYPPSDQTELHDLLQPHSELHVLDSNAGHDGFLLEQASIDRIGKQFLAKYLSPSHRASL